jgi:hypothetical protein
MNTAFLKVKLLDDFLKETHKHRQKLLEELIVKTNNPVIKMRRFRMLSQLAEYESVTIKKSYLLIRRIRWTFYKTLICQKF